MNLVEWNKAERRKRILAAARRIITRRGLAKLTMRELAAASRVSLPTVYSLVGGKDALVFALVEEILEEVLTRSGAEQPGTEGSAVARSFALAEVCVGVLLAAPAFSRQLLRHALTSGEYRTPLREVHRRNLSVVAQVVREGRDAGEFVSWIDPEAFAVVAYDQQLAAIMRWANEESDAEVLLDDALLGVALVLLGVATGDARQAAEVVAKEISSRHHSAADNTSQSPTPRRQDDRP